VHICDQSRLPSPWFSSHSRYSPTAPAVPSLRPFIPSGSLIRCKPVQMYHHHPTFLIGGDESSESGQSSYISSSYSVCSLLFCFGGGLPFHNVQSLTFCNLLEIPTAHFMTSSSRVCPSASYNVFTLPRLNSCLLLHPWVPLLVVICFLRRSYLSIIFLS
jgi:hypothetical protein